jgi:ubiquinone/menaquinone biosynthesis C-methylase UbiE
MLIEKKYVHGYSERESSRLKDQATTLSDYLHYDSIFPEGSRILEAGCGTGEQTVFIAKSNPLSSITSIDISKESLSIAEKSMIKNSIKNVNLIEGDIFNLKFDKESFDHIFICFVLEHLSDPVKALLKLKEVLKKNGTITVIEGDHGSAYFHPESIDAMHTIRCLIDLQAKMNGNSLIGRSLYPILKNAGFENIKVSPRIIYTDESKPDLVDGFTKKTFIAMVEGIKEDAIRYGLIDEKTWKKGINDLYKSASTNGTFSYTFFKSVAINV